MLQIVNKTMPALRKENVLSLNRPAAAPYNARTLTDLNRLSPHRSTATAATAATATTPTTAAAAAATVPAFVTSNVSGGKDSAGATETAYRRDTPAAQPATGFPANNLSASAVTVSRQQVQGSKSAAASNSAAPGASVYRPPTLLHPLKKGQKTVLPPDGSPMGIRVCVGWDTRRSDCEMDISAFLTDSSSRVPDERYFVFYGNTRSPDGSVCLWEAPSGSGDRQFFSVRLAKLPPGITRVIFVLTIHEAFERRLDFTQVTQLYVRILDEAGKQEKLSFVPDDGGAAVTSMTLGELYLHRGQWKFNPVGNGVRKDLAGQCAVYGVQVE